MNLFQRIANMAVYEWRRALAKKKFLVLVILTLALQIMIFLSFNFILADPPPDFFDLEAVKATMWLVGVLGPQELFMPLIAIVIAGGSLSEEYEQGTADILLSKPISKFEYLTGKYFGGLTLSSFVIALTTILGLTLAYGFFGLQASIQFVPIIYLSLIYTNLLFFSMSFMFSEVLRRTTLAILTAIGIFVASMVISSYLTIMYSLTQGQFYLNFSMWLPNWSVSSFPIFVASRIESLANNPFLPVEGGNLQLAATIILVYTVFCILLAIIRLMRTDITKKAT